MKVYVGIDNGATGTIGIINENGSTEFLDVPVKKEQNYTKKKDIISRLDFKTFFEILKTSSSYSTLIALERPLVNPTRFKATCSALRIFEAELVVIEMLQLPYIFIDSKEWQRVLLPSGIKGSDELKKASCDIACRLFPKQAEKIKKHKDGDGLLIAEFLKRKKL